MKIAARGKRQKKAAEPAHQLTYAPLVLFFVDKTTDSAKKSLQLFGAGLARQLRVRGGEAPWRPRPQNKSRRCSAIKLFGDKRRRGVATPSAT